MDDAMTHGDRFSTRARFYPFEQLGHQSVETRMLPPGIAFNDCARGVPRGNPRFALDLLHFAPDHQFGLEAMAI
jgi:hypothetical protein